MNLLSSSEIQLLRVLAAKPLSVEEVVTAMTPMQQSEVKSLLYQLDSKYLIVKQPVIGGGCRDCACQITYGWRLTFRGRQSIPVSEST